MTGVRPSLAGVTRRQALRVTLWIGLGTAVGGCNAEDGTFRRNATLPTEVPGDPPAAERYSDNVDALCDVLLPAQFDASGALTSPGAREARVDKVLSTQNFASLAMSLGFLTSLSETTIANLNDLSDTVRAELNSALDALAALQRPLTSFRDLPRALQEAVVDDSFADDNRRPVLLVIRAACMGAYLGAMASDIGIQDIGFPPYENFDDGLAVSGYPRTRSGRLVDPATDNLAQLAAENDLDDYTYNLAPQPTSGDDLSTILNAEGDIL